MGGVVAFEMAQQLRRQGQKIELLALMDVPPPPPAGAASALARPLKKAWDKVGGKDSLTLIKNFGEDMGLPLDKLNADTLKLSKLSPEDQLAYMLDKAAQADRLPPGFDAEHIRFLFGVFKANVEALQGYAANKYDGRVALFTADERFLTDSRNPVEGWSKLVPQGFDFQATPGNHYTMLKRPHVEKLAARLREQIARVRGDDRA
jgi:thioesterase domain-containing protein